MKPIFPSLFLLSLFSRGICSPFPPELPHRTLAGFKVIDTPIVRDALAFAEKNEDNGVFNHSIRSWIYGSIIINKNPVYTKLVDEEVHALGTILHDIGFEDTPNPSQFDHDHAKNGEKGVRKFLGENAEGKTWKDTRVQAVVDAVVLHLTDSDPSQSLEVRAVKDGQLTDLEGPGKYVTAEEFKAVIAAYPWGAAFEPFAPKAAGGGGFMPSGMGSMQGADGMGHSHGGRRFRRY